MTPKSEYKNENISNKVFRHQKDKELEKNFSKYIPNFWNLVVLGFIFLDWLDPAFYFISYWIYV